MCIQLSSKGDPLAYQYLTLRRRVSVPTNSYNFSLDFTTCGNKV